MSMTAAELEIIVGADTTQAETGLSNLDSKVKNSSGSWSQTGLTFTGIFAGISAGFWSLIEPAVNFEAVVVDLGIALGITGEELQQMEGWVLDMGAAFPFSAEEVALLATELGKLGFSVDEVKQLAESVLYLTTAIGGDLVANGEAVAKIINSLGLTAEDASWLVQDLFAVLQSGSLDLSTFMEAWKNLGSTVKLAGMSFIEAAAFITLLTDSGINAATAGNALRKLFTELLNPSEELKAKLTELGIAFKDAEGNMLSVKDIILNIMDAWTTMLPEDRLELAELIGGQEYMGDLITLFDKGRAAFDGLIEKIKSVPSLLETAKQKMSTAKQSFETFLETINNLRITIGTKLLPAFKQLIGVLTPIVESMTNIPGPVWMVIAGFLALTGAVAGIIGPLALGIAAFKQVADAVGFLKGLGVGAKALKGLGTAAKAAGVGFNFLKAAVISNPVVAIVLALVAAFALLYKFNVFGFADKVNAAMSWIRDAFVDVMPYVQLLASLLEGQLRNALDVARDAITLGANKVKELITAFLGLEPVKAVIEGVGDVVSGLIDTFKSLLANDPAGFFDNLGKTAKAAFDLVLDSATMLPRLIIAAFQAVDWSGVWEGLKSGASAAFSWVLNAIRNIDWGSLIQGGWNVIQQGIALAWDAITSLDWKSFIPNFGEWGQWITHKIASLADWGIDTFGGWAVYIAYKLGSLAAWGIDTFGGWGTYILYKLSSLAQWGIGTFGSWGQWITHKLSDLGAWGIKTFAGWSSFIPFKLNSLSQWGISTFGGWSSFITHSLSSLASWGISKLDWSTFIPETLKFPSSQEILDAIVSVFTGGSERNKAQPDRDGEIASPASPNPNPGNSPAPDVADFGGVNLGGIGVLGSALAGIVTKAGLAKISLDNYNQSQIKTGFDATTSFNQLGTSSSTNFGLLGSTMGLAGAAMLGSFIPNVLSMAATSNSQFSAINSSVSSNTSSARASVASNAASMASSLLTQMGAMSNTASSRMAAIASTTRTQMNDASSSVSTQMAAMSLGTSLKLALMATTTNGKLGEMVGSTRSQTASMASAMAGGMTSTTMQITLGASRWAGIITNAGASAVGNARAVGYNVGSALASGMLGALGTVTAAANALIAQVDRAMRAKAQIHSPSRMTSYFGEMLGEGLVVGMHDMIGDVARMGTSLADAATVPPSLAFTPSSSSVGAGTYAGTAVGTTVNNSQTYNITISVDDLEGYQKAADFFDDLENERQMTFA